MREGDPNSIFLDLRSRSLMSLMDMSEAQVEVMLVQPLLLCMRMNMLSLGVGRRVWWMIVGLSEDKDVKLGSERFYMRADIP